MDEIKRVWMWADNLSKLFLRKMCAISETKLNT